MVMGNFDIFFTAEDVEKTPEKFGTQIFAEERRLKNQRDEE
jgi:hypothetical protein